MACNRSLCAWDMMHSIPRKGGKGRFPHFARNDNRLAGAKSCGTFTDTSWIWACTNARKQSVTAKSKKRDLIGSMGPPIRVHGPFES